MRNHYLFVAVASIAIVGGSTIVMADPPNASTDTPCQSCDRPQESQGCSSIQSEFFNIGTIAVSVAQDQNEDKADKKADAKKPKKKKKSPPTYNKSVPTPTQSSIKYGPHKRNIFDFWQAKSDLPTPLVLVIHGGGWNGGTKEQIHKYVDVSKLLNSGISVAAIHYRLIKDSRDLKPPVQGPMYDSARALQFFRSNAAQWNIDPTRIAAAGGSAGACTSLWLAYHDDLADPDNEDPVLRESTRLTCAAVHRPQTTLDPKQMKEWMPNSKYGAHAFGIDGFDAFLAQRDSISEWLAEYSPYALAGSDDPPVYLFFLKRPKMGEEVKDPTHSANFGIGLQKHCKELGIECDVMYPGAKNLKFETTTDFLIAKLLDKDLKPKLKP